MLKSNKYTQKMKSLEPDVEEQALLAGISMFSPFLRNVRDHDDIHLLSKIQVSKKTFFGAVILLLRELVTLF